MILAAKIKNDIINVTPFKRVFNVVYLLFLVFNNFFNFEKDYNTLSYYNSKIFLIMTPYRLPLFFFLLYLLKIDSASRNSLCNN